jgi:DNA recombination protein RmuC
MDQLSAMLQLLTLGLVVVTGATALAILLIVIRKRKPDEESGVDVDALAATVRTEADRVRTDTADQSRGLRQELGDAIRGFQDFFTKRLDAGIEGVRAPVTEIGQKLDADMRRMAEEAATNRDTLRHSIETKLDATDLRLAASAKELREALTGNFGQTSDLLSGNLQTLGEHQRERLDKMLLALESLNDRQAQAQEALRTTVETKLDAIRTENAAKLDEMRQTVNEKLETALEKRLGESFRTVSEQLERVHAGLGEMQTLAVGVGDLKKVLTNVKTRGTLGEGLADLHLGDFLSPEQYVVNAQVKPNTKERVDYAVRFPHPDMDGDLLLPIDAKFPMEDYERLIVASDKADIEEIAAATAALEARVKDCAKSISEKYINPPVTTDYAYLFLPTEGLFAEVLRRRGLQEHIQREYHVSIVGPTTLASVLSAFRMGFRTVAIQKRSGEVWQLLSAVRAEFANHGKVVDTLKKQLNAATNTIDKLGTRTNAMNRKLREVEVLPVGDAQALLGLAAPAEEAEENPAEDEE